MKRIRIPSVILAELGDVGLRPAYSCPERAYCHCSCLTGVNSGAPHRIPYTKAVSCSVWFLLSPQRLIAHSCSPEKAGRGPPGVSRSFAQAGRGDGRPAPRLPSRPACRQSDTSIVSWPVSTHLPSIFLSVLCIWYSGRFTRVDFAAARDALRSAKTVVPRRPFCAKAPIRPNKPGLFWPIAGMMQPAQLPPGAYPA